MPTVVMLCYEIHRLKIHQWRTHGQCNHDFFMIVT